MKKNKTWIKISTSWFNKKLFFILLPIILLIVNKQFSIFVRKFTISIIPILAAVLIALAIKPLQNKLQRKLPKLSEKKAAIYSLALVILFIWLLIYLAWPPILYDISYFINQIQSPSFIVQLSEQIQKLFPKINAYQYLLQVKTQIIEFLSKNLQSWIFISAKSTSAIVLKILLSFAIAGYLLVDYAKVQKIINSFTISHPKTKAIIKDLKMGIGGWARGWIKDQTFIFVLTLGLLLSLGVQSAFTLAIVMTIFNFIPFVGPIIGGIIIIIYTAATYLSVPTSTLLFLFPISATTTIIATTIGVIIIQTIESLWWIPKVYGKEANISPVLILIALSLVGAMISPFVTPLTIPLIIIIRSIYNEYFTKK